MTVVAHRFAQQGLEDDPDCAEVDRIAELLLAHLNTPAATAALELANQPMSSSALVQAVFLPFALELGFRSEAKGLFSEYLTPALRPDYFLPVGRTGILMEVERGKTTTNNMDLLDLWKCHLCQHADYLFLLVPQALRHNAAMTPKREYASVVKRLDAFFRPENYTNVKAAHILGY